MPQYFLTIPHDTAEEPTMESMQEMDPVELEAMMAAVDRFNSALQDSGAFVHAGGLHPPSTAVTVDATAPRPSASPVRSWRRRSTSAGSGSSKPLTRKPRSPGRTGLRGPTVTHRGPRPPGQP